MRIDVVFWLDNSECMVFDLEKIQIAAEQKNVSTEDQLYSLKNSVEYIQTYFARREK